MYFYTIISSNNLDNKNNLSIQLPSAGVAQW